MSFELIPTSVFLKELKKLKKKYPSLESDLENLGELLLSNPRMGVEVYKIATKSDLRSKANPKAKVEEEG